MKIPALGSVPFVQRKVERFCIMPQPTTHSYPKNRKRAKVPERLGMTRKNAAAHLGGSTTTVKKYIDSGTIRTLADGSIDPAQFPDLVEFLDFFIVNFDNIISFM